MRTFVDSPTRAISFEYARVFYAVHVRCIAYDAFNIDINCVSVGF